jgi:MtN3 and saliva related transmembrane protein
MEATDVLGYTAGALTTIALVPQAWRSFRTKDVSGISLRMYCIFTLGVAIWLAYGILLKETPMILANSVSLVLAFLVLAMKLKYRHLEQDDGGKPRMAEA